MAALPTAKDINTPAALSKYPCPYYTVVQTKQHMDRGFCSTWIEGFAVLESRVLQHMDRGFCPYSGSLSAGISDEASGQPAGKL